MEQYLTKETKCPYCGYKIDAASKIIGGGEGPEKGNISICIYCQRWSIYKNDHELRRMTEKEIEDLSEDERQMLINASRIVRLTLKESKGG